VFAGNSVIGDHRDKFALPGRAAAATKLFVRRYFRATLTREGHFTN